MAKSTTTTAFLSLLLFCLSSFCLCSCPVTVGIDQAWVAASLDASVKSPNTLYVRYTFDSCIDCSDQFLVATSPISAPVYTPFDTMYSGDLFLYDSQDGSGAPMAFIRYNFNEHGRYLIVISQEGANLPSMSISVLDDGNNIYNPILSAVGVLLMGCFVLYGSEILYNKYKERMAPAAYSAIAPGPARPMKERLKSLDTFRGFSLCVMIFVNYGGGQYAFFNHSLWNGITLADLVFPWFIFMMGVSMAISFHSLIEKQRTSKSTMIRRIAMRTMKLAFLSLLVSNGGPPTFSQVRIPGVLMRFAVAYFVIGCIIVYIPKVEPERRPRDHEAARLDAGPVNGRLEDDDREYDYMSDLRRHMYEYPILVVFLIMWLYFTFGFNVPGCGRGYIGPGGPLVDGGKYNGCTGGVNLYIDNLILGNNHLYQTPTPQPVYLTGAYDPEGILGNLTSILMVYFGVMIGRVIVYHQAHHIRLSRWFIHGTINFLMGLSLCGWDITWTSTGIIPLNKNMWSLSFILFLSGLAIYCLIILYLLIDRWSLWTGNPFLAMGMNSIVVYVTSEILGSSFPVVLTQDGTINMPCPEPSSHSFQLVSDLFSTCFFVFMANWMHWEKFYINL